jgi:hypothetical protein
MAKDSENEAAGGKLRKLVIPTAVGVAGSAIAVVLTKKPKQLDELVPKVREAMPDLPQGGVGELTDDLKGRLDSVLGKGDDELDGLEEQAPSDIDAAKFEQRREERRKRREQRRRAA